MKIIMNEEEVECETLTSAITEEAQKMRQNNIYDFTIGRKRNAKWLIWINYEFDGMENDCLRLKMFACDKRKMIAKKTNENERENIPDNSKSVSASLTFNSHSIYIFASSFCFSLRLQNVSAHVTAANTLSRTHTHSTNFPLNWNSKAAGDWMTEQKNEK